jgi:tRNA dimethylallyltransferase
MRRQTRKLPLPPPIKSLSYYPLLAVVGPTASGKTELGLQLALEQNGEIISVDSRQVYKFLSIGTAKPKGHWVDDHYIVNGIPYGLADIWDPGQPFTAAEFVRLAQPRIAEIQSRGKRPILVGGTGLYFKALFEGLAALPERDDTLRAELRAFAESHGRPALHAELVKVDPEAATAIPPNNIQRVIRALEVHRLTGKPISRWHQEHQDTQKTRPLNVEWVGIALPREELNKRIQRRAEQMLDEGLIEETHALLQRGYTPGCPALTGLGYPRVIAHIQGTLSRADLLKMLIQDTRQYAKRQMTWFRHQAHVQWKTL